MGRWPQIRKQFPRKVTTHHTGPPPPQPLGVTEDRRGFPAGSLTNVTCTEHEVLGGKFPFTSDKHHSSVWGQRVGSHFGGVVLGTGSWPEDTLRGALQSSHLAFLCFPSTLCPQTQPISLCGEEKQR